MDINPGPSDRLRSRCHLWPTGGWPASTCSAAPTRAAGARPRGRPAGRPGWPARVELIRRHQVSVVGFQEMQGNQRGSFLARSPRWALFPNNTLGNSGENSDRLEHRRVGAGQARRRRRSPTSTATSGRCRSSCCATRPAACRPTSPTSTTRPTPGRFRHQQRFRNEATRREIALFNVLQKTGIPVFVTGDMNERAEYFCQVAGATGLIAASGARVEHERRRLPAYRGRSRSTGSWAARTSCSTATPSTAAPWFVVRRTTRWSPRTSSSTR